MRKATAALALGLGASLLLGACGEPDTRSFLVENAIFESLHFERRDLGPARESPESRAAVGSGLSAICQGDVSGAKRLIADGGIGNHIYPLVLIAAKAARNHCDYSGWHDKQSLLGERFKQLVNSGDAAAVLLAALIDRNLAEADRLQVVKALADKRYSHAEAIYADMLLGGDSPAENYRQALDLLEDAAKQGATPAKLLLARMHREGLGTPKDPDKACKYLQDAAKGGIEKAASELGKLRESKACP